ncbi:hypothetical protein Ciccas_007272 [Cichlidogyrus casuarinus]|uniref:Uncharacterized protein n=1 Tax=Cichlidogyrus casuarinus TaxID=1844966 RepID=A0ABD2Q3B9_9PLAT
MTNRKDRLKPQPSQDDASIISSDQYQDYLQTRPTKIEKRLAADVDNLIGRRDAVIDIEAIMVSLLELIQISPDI